MIRIDAASLAITPIDMRAGTETAMARMVAVFGAAHPHTAYLFANKRGTRLKVLVHDGIGIWWAAREWKGFQGLRIAGDCWGEPSSLPVILQHGGGQTRHAWKSTGEVLGAAGFLAVAFDARGHGDSDWSAQGDYSQDAMVRDLQCVVASFGQRKVVLVGASTGGGTSLVAAGERFVDASALVLVDIAPRLELKGVQAIQLFMNRNPQGFASLDEVADAIASYQPHRERPKNLQGLAKNVRLGEDGRFHWHWDPRFLLGHRDLKLRQARLEACARALTSHHCSCAAVCRMC